MSTPRDKAVERARKLSALSKDQSDSPEGATAGRLLTALRERWSISDEELAPREDDVLIYRILVEFGEPRVRARADLLSVLGHIADVLVTYRMEEGGAWVGRVYAEDLARCQRVVDAFHEVESWLNHRIRRYEDETRARLPKAMAAKWIDAWKGENRHLRDWWSTACAVLLRIFRENHRDTGDRMWSEVPPTPGAPGAPADRPLLDVAPPALPEAPMAENQLATVPGASVAIKEHVKRIGQVAQTAPPDAWKWCHEAEEAICAMPWPFKDTPAPVSRSAPRRAREDTGLDVEADADADADADASPRAGGGWPPSYAKRKKPRKGEGS